MESLIQLLISCGSLLQSVGESFWADKIQAVVRKGKNNIDIYSLKEILSWYGGMGSFNDLMLSEYNDHLIDAKDEEKLNNELNRLRSQIYHEAERLKRSLEP